MPRPVTLAPPTHRRPRPPNGRMRLSAWHRRRLNGAKRPNTPCRPDGSAPARRPPSRHAPEPLWNGQPPLRAPARAPSGRAPAGRRPTAGPPAGCMGARGGEARTANAVGCATKGGGGAGGCVRMFCTGGRGGWRGCRRREGCALVWLRMVIVGGDADGLAGWPAGGGGANEAFLLAKGRRARLVFLTD